MKGETMKRLSIRNGLLDVSAIGLGCWRFRELPDVRSARSLVDAAFDLGIDFFDHADIYAGGEAEALFGEAITPEQRKKMTLQTKCAIVPGICYDFSRSHILEAVEGSLRRLRTDHIDILLLHRPDALMEPEEVAAAFDKLHSSGKVSFFGVSNHNPGQIALLNKYCGGRIIFDQMQLSIPFCPMIDAGLNVNMYDDQAVVRDGGLIDYCRLNEITIQAWSPFQGGPGEGVFLRNEKYSALNALIGELAEKYGVSLNAIAAAWIMRHPAHIQVLAGTTNPSRLAEIAQASDVTLTREEWYRLYLAAGKPLP